ncbi:MAG: hypothetical protein AABX90_02275 [Nanoarchaeota archaeon]
MFIRSKKIKNQEYAYLVKNIWRKRKKSSRQKSSKYLGKLYKFNKIKNNSLEEYINITDINKYLEKTPDNKIIKDLLKLELLNHGFQQKSKNIFLLNNFKVNLSKKTVIDTKTKKPICLEINNNFLCNYTLSRIINFIPKKDLTELQIGKQLANAFESAGIIVPKELFVIIAQKILNDLEADIRIIKK